MLLNNQLNFPSFRLAGVLLLGCLFSLPAFAQNPATCDQKLHVENAQELVVLGTVDDGDTFSVQLRLSSKTGGTFSIKASNLRDEQIKRYLDASTIGFEGEGIAPSTPGKATITFQKGEQKDLTITLQKPQKPGLYRGSIVLYCDSVCQYSLPLRFRYRDASEAFAIPANDEAIVVQTIPPSWFSFLLPGKMRQQGIAFRVENKTLYPASIERLTLSLKGVATQGILTEANFLADTALQLQAKEMRVFHLVLKAGTPLKPDEYKGQLQVYVKDNAEPLNVSVQLFRRSGVGSALLVVLFGILMGWLFKDLDKKKGQLELVGQLFRLNRSVVSIDDDIAQQQLMHQSKALELAINEADTEETLTKAKEDLAAFSQKVKQMLELVVEMPRVLKAAGDAPQRIEAANQMADALRDAILEGDADKITTAKEQLNNFMTAADAGSRGLFGKLGNTESSAQPAAPSPLSDFLKRIQKAWENIRSKWGTLRTTYLYLQPLGLFVTVVVFALMGLHELYVNGKSDFGSDGVYDFLKLFLWGAVSNLVPRTLFGATQAQDFGKPAGDNG